MTQTISVPTLTFSNYEEDSWDDIEFPKTGLLLVNNNNDYGFSTDMSGIYSSDDDSDEDDYFGKCGSNKSTPASSSSSINKVKEIMINSRVAEFAGLKVPRIIGGENNKVIADDLDNDMGIPEDGFANLTTTINKKNRSNSTVSVINDFEFDSLDEQNIITKNSITSPKELIINIIKDPSEVLFKSSTKLESFDDDFDFSVDLSKLNLSAEALKLHQGSDEGNLNDKDPFGSKRYSSRNSSCLFILQSPACSQSTFESGEEENLFDDIQLMDSLISYNDDDDDFENVLDISNENVFDPDLLKDKNITIPNSTQQKHIRRESFSIEFNAYNRSSPSISLTSSEVHPKTTSNNSFLIPSLQTNKAFSKSLTSLGTSITVKNSTKSTFIKSPISHLKSPKSPKLRVRELVKKPISLMRSKSANYTSKLSSKKTNNKKRYQQINITHDNTPNLNSNILEIMREPKGQQSFGDGTELDEFDDLPIIDREHSYTTSNCTRHDRDRISSISSVGSETDNSDNLQHHQRHKDHRKRKKPQLIRNLNADKNFKVVGEMVYNQITHRWDGNDSVLKGFDNALSSPTRPALISNMNNTNTKSFQVVGKMKFDPIKMCWNNDSSDDEEIWARFDCPQASDNDTSSANIKRNEPTSLERQSKYHQLENVNLTDDNSNDFQVGSEFDITPRFFDALLASERQHHNEVKRWYPNTLSKKNELDTTLQRSSYLYDLRNNNNKNRNASSGNNSKIYHNNRSGGLFEAAMNPKRHERRHFH